MVSVTAVFIYMIALVGSFSLGYLLLRTASPKKQGLEISKKLMYGYAIGAPIILVSAVVGEEYFFFILAFFSTLVFAIALTKRVSFKEEDFVKLEKKTGRKMELPERVLTKEEISARAKKEAIEKYGTQPTAEGKSAILPAVPPAPIQPRIDVQVKEQVFKEKKSNILKQVQKETKKIEETGQAKERDEVLKRLRRLSMDVRKKPAAKKNEKGEFEIEDLEFE